MYNTMVRIRAAIVLGASLLLMPTAALAAPPISIKNAVNPDFGTLMGGAAGRTFRLGTDGQVSGPYAGDYLSGASAGSVDIKAAKNSAIDILATNLGTDKNVAITRVFCKYGFATPRDCSAGFSATGAQYSQGITMKIGLEIRTLATHSGGEIARPGFDIMVVYQ